MRRALPDVRPVVRTRILRARVASPGAARTLRRGGLMRTIVGVMGSGEDGDAALLALARELGAAIAGEGWVLLNGGRGGGVMDASAEGASLAGGLVVGVLPDDDTESASRHLDIPIRTGLGDARNAVNVLSSDVVIALRGGAGTL